MVRPGKTIVTYLFPSYLFIHIEQAKLHDLMCIPGIVRIIYFTGKPAVVKAQEINAIKQFLEYANGKECQVELDDEVRVAIGPMENNCGKVIRIGKKYAVLLLEKLNLKVQVALESVVKS